MPGTNFLSDIRVADMTTVIFGPYCTQTLADMGADVIKVEPDGGDDFREVGKPAATRGMGPCHMTINRGKRSVVWDLKSEAGQEAIRALIAGSDVFIHNIRPDAVERLGLTFEEVKTIKPDIVYVHCLGFGTDGPYAGRPAYDDLIQGLSGAASLLPRVDGNPKPRFIPTAFADKVSGLHAVYATLAALRQRDKTGEAVHVEVPMFECITHFLLEEHFYEAVFDPPVGPVCYQRQVDPSRQPLQTSDGWIVVAPYVDARWVRLFDVLGAPEELQDERLSDRRGRYYNMAYMMERVQFHLTAQPTRYWLDAFAASDIPAAPVNDMGELQDDPHLQAVGFFRKREHPTEGGYWETQPPVTFRGAASRTIRPAPLVGEHTDEVLAELGLGVPARRETDAN
ncbi:CaiB/BaiF CoA transferase family protein [Hyphomonas johnsonii]|uniref:L-carnitine dehydratase/bile acid-inducible protein n=1 Tax=Hyphomonas johnsonii MHS-2 TaxID=1280950 RepID=A0A059FS47_9PROT|nr:CoA transferase [Hyphomonas johnsonii]KCZ93485.1 L-carnitine dehydratase/bile acid-inducible protein [Hyphomonas johnsonii MHS-2]